VSEEESREMREGEGGGGGGEREAHILLRC